MPIYQTTSQLDGAYIINARSLREICATANSFLERSADISVELDRGHQIETDDVAALLDAAVLRFGLMI
jgi:hypothetical protein